MGDGVRALRVGLILSPRKGRGSLVGRVGVEHRDSVGEDALKLGGMAEGVLGAIGWFCWVC